MKIIRYRRRTREPQDNNKVRKALKYEVKIILSTIRKSLNLEHNKKSHKIINHKINNSPQALKPRSIRNFQISYTMTYTNLESRLKTWKKSKNYLKNILEHINSIITQEN